MNLMRVNFRSYIQHVHQLTISIDSLAGQLQAMKTGVAPLPAKKKIAKKKTPLVEEDDDESDTDGEVDDDTSETNTDTDTDGE